MAFNPNIIHTSTLIPLHSPPPLLRYLDRKIGLQLNNSSRKKEYLVSKKCKSLHFL